MGAPSMPPPASCNVANTTTTSTASALGGLFNTTDLFKAPSEILGSSDLLKSEILNSDLLRSELIKTEIMRSELLRSDILASELMEEASAADPAKELNRLRKTNDELAETTKSAKQKRQAKKERNNPQVDCSPTTPPMEPLTGELSERE